MGIADKIAAIEAEIARTQKNKATEHHLGSLKAKLAKYRVELAPQRGVKEKGDGFEVQRSGHARVALIGFPSVGKSTLLSSLTETYSRQAESEFTTLGCISGRLEHKNAVIQLLDLPGIVDGAAANRGRGRQVITVARTADLVVMLLSPHRTNERDILVAELNKMGIRLNRSRPDVTLLRCGLGINITTTCKLTHIDESLIEEMLLEYKIRNCQLTIREDITDDDLIDIISGTGTYINCIFCYNKIDRITYSEFEELAKNNENFVISCSKKWNLDELKEEIWKKLSLVRIYTRKKGEQPDFSAPIVLRSPCKVLDLCRQIHRDFELKFKYAMVWGRSAKHSPQQVGFGHSLSDEDVVQLYTK